MRLLARLLLPVLALGAAVPVAAQAPDPLQIIATFREATGGSAWDGLEGMQRTDTHSGDTILTWVDLRRPALRTESQGRDVWSRGGPFDGGLELSRGLLDQYQAATDAFIAAQGYFFPDRFPFAARWVREERDGDRVFDVVELAPDGGFVRDYWFDRASGLLVRITAPTGR